MKTILVPIDFSRVSEKTAATAFSLVQDIHVNVVFLHVLDGKEPIQLSTTARKESTAAQSVRSSEPTEKLRELVRKAQAQGIIATYRIVQGATIAQILDQAKQLRADLIVMGSHDYGNAEGSTVGSTTRGVLYATPCPIVVVPSDRTTSPVSRPQFRELQNVV